MNDQHFVVFVAQLAAIPKNQIGPVVGNAIEERYTIVRALDMLFTGV